MISNNCNNHQFNVQLWRILSKQIYLKQNFMVMKRHHKCQKNVKVSNVKQSQMKKKYWF